MDIMKDKGILLYAKRSRTKQLLLMKTFKILKYYCRTILRLHKAYKPQNTILLGLSFRQSGKNAVFSEHTSCADATFHPQIKHIRLLYQKYRRGNSCLLSIDTQSFYGIDMPLPSSTGYVSDQPRADRIL